MESRKVFFLAHLNQLHGVFYGNPLMDSAVSDLLHER